VSDLMTRLRHGPEGVRYDGASTLARCEGRSMSRVAMRRVTTEEERERLSAARRQGDRCAGCGRPLSVDEPVYIEYFMVTRMTPAEAPVGAECASAIILERAAGAEPERCVWCGRGVYYPVARSTRHRALCSRRCASRANAAKRATPAKAEG
jgi:hypothetical protein